VTEKSRDVESVFHEARQLRNASDRASFLSSACENNADLRSRVEELLAADAELSSFLDPDETVAAPTGARGRSSSGGSASLPSSEQPGSVIGRYKLLQQIGEGGFGVVYKAEQREPVQRNVALKVIKLGMDTKDVIARFEQERQALAMMDHPNIARVLDAGATDTGRPYFVMELVKGIPITEYCDKQNMTFRDRLNLFIQVCGAVQHAHQKGIIHRDIKPSNVLVTHFDDKPVPKVIDFGIAKATQQKLTERTMFTQFGQFMGTPAYMSPEQADSLGMDIDTRSDIYALGVLLYELLTGATPFEMQTLRGAALDEIKRIIREKDPPKPSTRLSTIGGDLATVARQRCVDPKKLTTILRGDLDWIIMKALEKDRTRRYETATEFARDVERYLNHEPVHAGPPSATYRIHKFVRRNRTGVAAATVALATVIGFAATMTVQARRIAAERDRANYEREMSDRVVEFQGKMLRRIRPFALGESIASDLRGRLEGSFPDEDGLAEQRHAALASFDGLVGKINLTDTARHILDVNVLAPAVKAVEAQFGDQPATEARLQEALSRTYHSLGLLDHALTRSRRAVDLYREHLGPEHAETLRTLSMHAMNLWELGRNAESGAILEKALPAFERVLGPEDQDTLTARVCLAVLDTDRGLKAKATKEFEAVLKLQERVLGPEHEDVASTLSNLGIALINQDHHSEAIPVLERAFAIRLKEIGPDADSTLFVMQSLATSYGAVGRGDEATKLQFDAMQRVERHFGTRHPTTLEAVTNLARLYKDQGRFMEAEPAARKSLELHRAVHGDSHRKTMKAMTDLGIIVAMLGRHKEAGPIFVEAYERSKASLGADHPDTINNLNNLAVHYWFLGQYQKALEFFTESLAGEERRFGKDHVETTNAMANLAVIYIKLGRLEEAQALLDRTLAICIKAFGEDHAKTLQARSSIVTLRQAQGDIAGAERLYAALVPAQKKVFGPDHPYTLESMNNWGQILEKLGRNDEAIGMLATCLEGRRRVTGAEHSETLDTATELARLRYDAGQVAEARVMFLEVIAARRRAASAEGASAAQLNACARVLLYCKLEDLRDPAEALGYAQMACSATDNSDPGYLSTMAKAQFENGQAAKATETQRKAISLLPEGAPDRSEFEALVAEYAAGDQS